MKKFTFRSAALTRREFVELALKGTTALTLGSAVSGAFAAAQTLKLGNIPVVNFAAVYRLRAIGKDFGFDVEFINFPNGTERLNALAAGTSTAPGPA
jgi:ABC-type nitrate/sulfonate/bicarbonate transport system substrate-binding protein